MSKARRVSHYVKDVSKVFVFEASVVSLKVPISAKVEKDDHGDG